MSISDLDADWEEYKSLYCKEPMTILQASVLVINAPNQAETVSLLKQIGWNDFWANEALKLHRIAKCEVMERIVQYVFH